MDLKRYSLKSFLRGGAAALAIVPLIATSAFAGEPQGSRMAPTDAQIAAANAAAPHVKTPLGVNDQNTTTPIKHVIIITGENRSFDHVYATYKAPSGDKVLNLLSEGIVLANGKPGKNFALAVQNTASVTTNFSIAPNQTGAYVRMPATNLNYTPNQQTYTSAPFISVPVAAKYDYGLLPTDLVDATTGASGLPYQTIDTRITNVTICSPDRSNCLQA